MTRPLPRLLSLSLLLLATPALAQHNPALPLLGADEIAQLEAGEVVVRLDGEYLLDASVVGVINAPSSEVVGLLENRGHLRLFVPAITESSVAGQEGSFHLQSGELDTPWPLDARRWTMRTWQGDARVDGQRVWIGQWDYVAGSGNLAECYGHWLVMPWGGGRTLVQLRVTVDLGTWLPGGVRSWAVDELLPQFIEGLRGQLTRTS